MSAVPASDSIPAVERIFSAADITFGVAAAGGADADVAALEGAGVESFWAGGHIAGPRPTPEPVTSVAWLAARTTTSVVGTAILQLPLYPPAIVAKQFAELDRFSGGRVVLGVGVAGEHAAEFDAVQVPVAGRGNRCDEALALIRRLWTEEDVHQTGGVFPVSGVTVRPAPLTPGGPKIVVAGRGNPATRRAAAHDGWMPYLYSPERYRDSVEQVAALRASTAPFAWMLWVVLRIDADRSRALRDVADRQPGPRDRALELAGRYGVGGTTEDVTERLCRYVDAGVRHFIFAVSPADRAAQVSLLVSDVMPAVTDHHRRRAASGASGPTEVHAR